MKKSGNSHWLRAGILTCNIACGERARRAIRAGADPGRAPAPAKTSELDEIVVTGTTIAQKDHGDLFCGHGRRPGNPQEFTRR